MLEEIARQSPLLIWGWFTRGVGLVFFASFASLSLQVLPIAGSSGIAPFAPTLRAMRRDFGRRALGYFPTLLWLNESDAALQWIPRVGMAAGLLVIAGGPLSPVALALCYVLYLSLDRPMGLVYPWDSLLCEVGFWGMFLPPLQWLPQLQATAAPAPALAWVFRILLFRVMFGFGKQKFLGTSARDSGFLQGFYIRQPLPTVAGWYAHRLPMVVHRAALLIMFFIEVPLPFAVFVPGWPSALFALSTWVLMAAIMAVGNFGFFNWLTIVLCLVCLDTSTPQALAMPTFAAFDPAVMGLHGLIALYVAGSVISLPFNTWCSFTWTLWPLWRRLPAGLTWPIAVLRWLQPLRWLHAYGVFPPRSAPAVRLAPVLQVTWDDAHWEELEYRYYPATERSRPPLCAPHHPRVDQAIVYEASGMNETGILRNLTGRWDPYGHTKATAGQQLARLLLSDYARAKRMFRDNAATARDACPRSVRARMYMLEPTTPAVAQGEGRWWDRTLIGPHFPELRREPSRWQEPPPPPELWHVDDRVWVGRSRWGRLCRRASVSQADPHRLVLELGDGLTEADQRCLWDEFIPSLCRESLSDWRRIRSEVDRARQRHDASTRYRLERLVGRYSSLLHGRAEPLFTEGGVLAILGLRQPRLPVKSNYELGLLCQYAVSLGCEHFDAVYREPARLAQTLREMTLCSAAGLSVVFRYETWVYQSQKLRLLESQIAQVGRPDVSSRKRRLQDWAVQVAWRAFGAFEMIAFLRGQFTEAEHIADLPERWPRFRLQADHSIVRSGKNSAPSLRAAVDSEPG